MFRFSLPHRRFRNVRVIVDNAIYVDGQRMEPCPFEETWETCRERGGFAWIGLYEPSRDEFDSVAGGFGLPELAIKDAFEAHSRPKVERYGDVLFVVLKAARYIEDTEEVEFGEIDIFVGRDFVVTVRHGEASALKEVRQQVEGNRELLRHGPPAILYAIMDRVVEDYVPVLDGLENDIDEIESEVFGNPNVSRRIYERSREVIEFHGATQPLAGALERLIESETHGGDDLEVRRYLRSIGDRVLRATEQIEGFRELLSNILNVNLTTVSVRQNEQAQKISA